MPAHIRKGLITGAPAFNSGGLGLSIGSRVGGIRHRIAARAPDGGKSDGGQLSFVVNNFSSDNFSSYADKYPGSNSAVAFMNYTSSLQHPTYNILENKNNVFLFALTLKGIDPSGTVSIGSMPLSKFITNVTSSSFELEVPAINATDIANLTENDYSGGDLYYDLSGTELVKLNDLPGQYLNGNNFFVNFVVTSGFQIEKVRTALQNYTGRTYKFELYSNDAGAIIVNNTTYKVNKFTNPTSTA